MSAARSAKWGWHQLDDRWARRLVAQADVSPGSLVIDIGAGRGAITRHLIRAGARVIAVELHPGRAGDLRLRYGPANVRVVQADASDLRRPRRSFSVVANPPFAITTSVLRRLLHPASRLQRADLIVPAHVGVRWATGRGADNRRWMDRFDAVITTRVPRAACHPPSPKPAVVLTFIRRV